MTSRTRSLHGEAEPFMCVCSACERLWKSVFVVRKPILTDTTKQRTTSAAHAREVRDQVTLTRGAHSAENRTSSGRCNYCCKRGHRATVKSNQVQAHPSYHKTPHTTKNYMFPSYEAITARRKIRSERLASTPNLRESTYLVPDDKKDVAYLDSEKREARRRKFMDRSRLTSATA